MIQGVGFMHIAFRWINCLLIREFELSISVRLWDTLLAEGVGIHHCDEEYLHQLTVILILQPGGFENFHVYVCAALLTTWSNEVNATNVIVRDMQFLHCICHSLDQGGVYI